MFFWREFTADPAAFDVARANQAARCGVVFRQRVAKKQRNGHTTYTA
jgi:hypothetical protein